VGHDDYPSRSTVVFDRDRIMGRRLIAFGVLGE
jgi:hypothetical protein